jgi:hypothetical protein
MARYIMAWTVLPARRVAEILETSSLIVRLSRNDPLIGHHKLGAYAPRAGRGGRLSQSGGPPASKSRARMLSASVAGSQRLPPGADLREHRHKGDRLLRQAVNRLLLAIGIAAAGEAFFDEWDLHPLESAAFPRRTPNAVILVAHALPAYNNLPEARTGSARPACGRFGSCAG